MTEKTCCGSATNFRRHPPSYHRYNQHLQAVGVRLYLHLGNLLRTGIRLGKMRTKTVAGWEARVNGPCKESERGI